MKLIIDINEEDFEIMKDNIRVDNPLCPINQKDMVIKIANGTPLYKIIEKIKQEPINVSGYIMKHKVLTIIDRYRKDGE